jgi:superfamily II RNA helicase
MSKFLRVLNTPFPDSDEFSSDPYDFGFELDSFQKHAISAIKRKEDVLVTAHTGSGKTVPAIFGIAHSLAANKKIIYTSPIKSLSNQKLFELRKKFPDVGILTGDIKFNPDAQCVIMTTEILRNILYQKESQHVNIDEVDKIIFDEVHYINDPDRGRVWEECIILAPRDITLIMLSATIDKADEFASWIGDIKQKPINLIPTSHRVVPLEHYFYMPDSSNPLVKVVDSKGNFQNYNQIKTNYGRCYASKIINPFLENLRDNNLVPALFFIFSRKECEKLAKSVHISLVSSEEIAEIDKIFNYEMRNHKNIYGSSNQYMEVHKLLLKGVVYHHSGLIPLLKEVIEVLFEKGLVKVLFATETFAVGVNMPTKTVIFPKLTKYSNGNFRSLRTDEYLQMAGRAGRRGLDKFGVVIILPTDELMNEHPLKRMMTGKSPSISSKFKLNYQFLLKILSNEDHNLDAFMAKTLFSIDNKNEIVARMSEKQILEGKTTHGLRTDDLKVVEEYHAGKQRLENMKGNARKRESMKLERNAREVKNFQSINSRYENYLKKKDDIRRLEGSITHLETFVNNDVEKMARYLKDNKYIDEETSKVLPRGIIASEISECNEILLTEIILADFFLDLSQEEIVATLAAFIEEKTNDAVTFATLDVPDSVKQVLSNINYIADDFGGYEYNSGIDIGTDWNLYLSFIGPAYEWACGRSIKEIYTKYADVYEGTFIRNILRIANILENIKNIGEMIGNADLIKKLENIETLLIRDNVTTESLYITKAV